MKGLTIGTLVEAKLPGQEPVVGRVVEGPVFKGGKAVFKIAADDFENWYPANGLSRFPRAVSEE